MRREGTCSVARCGDPLHAKGMCNRHYLRWWKGQTVDPLAGCPYHAYGFGIDPEAGVILGKMGRPVGRPNDDGYVLVIDGRRKEHRAHRLIWEAVHGPIPDGLEPNHKNGVKTDNRIANLELVTRAQNVRHAFATGLTSRKKGDPYRKLTVEAVREIRTGDDSLRVLARRYGVSVPAICAVRKWRTWKHVRPDVEAPTREVAGAHSTTS